MILFEIYFFAIVLINYKTITKKHPGKKTHKKNKKTNAKVQQKIQKYLNFTSSMHIIYTSKEKDYDKHKENKREKKKYLKKR